jgi:AbiJ-like protein
MKFSQRIGKTPVRKIIQIEALDKLLENRLWNVILNDFFGIIEKKFPSYHSGSIKEEIFKKMWVDFWGDRIDEKPHYNDMYSYIKECFFQSKWFEKYDFIEFLSTFDSVRIGFTEKCNEALKKEMSGYRIIDKQVVQITSEEEIVEIEEALLNSSIFKSVNTHLKTALEYLSNRENPDYRNSVKESISAVESFCVIITEDRDTTLGKALTFIEAKYKIHGALKSAFSSLYGYTSDSGGIRHSLLEDDIIVTMEDAKFMLVSCSAFINYLKVKIEK